MLCTEGWKKLEHVSAVIGDVGQCGDLGPLFIGCKSSTNIEEYNQKVGLNRICNVVVAQIESI
jgi:hypothetical protein